MRIIYDPVENNVIVQAGNGTIIIGDFSSPSASSVKIWTSEPKAPASGWVVSRLSAPAAYRRLIDVRDAAAAGDAERAQSLLRAVAA